MADEPVKFTDEERTTFYEQLGSANFKLQSEVNREYAGHMIDIYFKSIEFAATVVSTVGIVAGFGFTALSFVQSPLLFFVGEGLLLYSIIHGLVWIQKVYIGEFNSLDKAHTAHQKYFAERNAKFKSVWKDISTANEVDKSKFVDFIDTNNGAANLFAPPADKMVEQEGRERVIFSKKQYYLLIAGTICLLASFFIYTLLSLLCSVFFF